MNSNYIVQYLINLGGNVEQKIQAIENSTKKATLVMQNFSQSIQHIRDAGLAFDAIEGAADRLADKFGKVFTVGMENELQKQNLTTLLGGDIDAADTIFGKISEYGKNTVYDKAGLIEAQKTMMSFGISAEDAFGKLKQIGDIAMGDSQKMQSLALAFSQASSAGKLGGQDLMQMINAGFNPLQVISEKTGKSMGELKDEMAKGKITTEQMAQAFQWATEEGGMFYQGAEKAGQTLQGRLNQAKDNLNELILKVYDILRPYVENTMNLIGSVMERVTAFIDRWKGFVPVVTGVGIALMAFIGVTKLAAGFMSLYTGAMTVAKVATTAWGIAVKLATSPLFITVAVIAALIAAIVIVAKRTDGWSATWHNTMEYIKLSFAQCGAWLHKKWLEIEDSFLTGFESIKTGWYVLQSLWDKDAASEGLANIQQQRDERAQAILQAQGKIDELAEARKKIDVWQVKWKKKDEKEGAKENTAMGTLLDAVNGPTRAATEGSGATASKQSATATATGGTRSTTVNINLGKMVESIVFNGGYNENEQDMEQRLAAMLSRILGMAEATAG